MIYHMIAKSKMPSTRKMILGYVMSGLCSKMNRTKRVDGDEMETPLKRCLTTFDMTLLGVGHMMGAGIYVLIGSVANSDAGPGVILSFLIAGFASLLAAFCYAEFGARIPKAGSAYVYTYISIGEFWAFVIGWNIILEHMIGAASVARAWSGYVDSLANGTMSNFIRQFMGGSEVYEIFGSNIDPLAATICLIYTLLLGCGVKSSTRLNSVLTLCNIGVILLVINFGIQYIDFNNWTDEKHGGFLPYGYSGVLVGSVRCLYAFIGFDSIASSSEEARNPSRSIPLATGLSLIIVTVAYVLLSGILTLIVPYWQIDSDAAFSQAFALKGETWARYFISVGALCGMTTTLFGSLFSLPRIMYAMASDGLLFSFFGRVDKCTQLPIINLGISGILSALIAFFLDLHHLVEFMSIGTFLAYTIVSASVIILRYRPDNDIPHSIRIIKSDNANSPMSDTTSTNSSITGSSSPADSEISRCEQSNVGRLKKRYEYLKRFIGTWEPGTAVVAAVIIFIVGCICNTSVQSDLVFGSWNSVWSHLGQYYLFFIEIACLLVISAHEQAPATDKFRVPLVPIIPLISIYLNITLMSHYRILTWLRFLTWMLIGMSIYFIYGIHHSKEATGLNSYSVLTTSVEAEQAKARKATISGSKSRYNPLQSNINSDKLPILKDHH